MAELKPLQPIDPVQGKPVQTETAKQIEKQPEKVEISNDLLKKVNGELCFELEFPNGKILVSMSKCNRQIPAFKNMDDVQKLTFLEQAAIFGANPFGSPPDIFPVPFEVDGKLTYTPVIYFKKIIEVAASNPNYDGYKSGVTVETKDGQLIDRRGQVILSTDKLIGGWCEAFDKRLKEPIYRSVNLNEFIKRKKDGTPTKFWKDSPASQIEKVAIANCLGIAMRLPKFYIPEELPALDITHVDVTTQKAIAASNEDFFNK